MFVRNTHNTDITENNHTSIIKMKEIKHKTKRMKEVEIKIGGELEEILLTLWVDENKTREDVCSALSITPETLVNWLDAAHIYSRRLKFPDV